MLEVLITIIIVSLGLLGLAGLQARVQVAELEAYQRTQAIVLLQEMVDRINANRRNSMNYVTATPAGTGNAAGDCSGTTIRSQDSYATLTITGPASLSYNAMGRLAGGTVANISLTAPDVSTENSRCITVDLSGRPVSRTGACS